MQFENYRDESLISADLNAIWSREKSYPKWLEGNCPGPKRSSRTTSNVSLSPAFRGEVPRPGQRRKVPRERGAFCISCPVRADGEEPYVYDELPPRAASPGLIHRVVSPAHVPDVVTASILTDYGIGELIGQEKTGYRKRGAMQRACG